MNPVLIASHPPLHHFVDLLIHRSEAQPHKRAFVFLDRGEIEADHLTYMELDSRARAIAAHLQSLMAMGERALLLYPPGLDYITAFLGCLYAGVVAVPAYPPRNNQNSHRLRTIATDAEAAVILTCSSFLPSIQRWLDQEPELTAMHWLSTNEIATDDRAQWNPPLITSETLAFLQYTSGSTGNPKGVMISHGNLLHNSAAIHSCFGDTDQSQGVCWLPPYHDMGLIGGLLQPLYVGASTALMSPVDFLQKPIRWLQAIARYRATTSGGPNFAYELCASKVKPEQIEELDLSCWQLAFTGAEPVRARTLNQFVETFANYGFRREAFYPCYGMAETTLIVSGGARTQAPIVQPIEAEALEQNQVVKTDSTEIGNEDVRWFVGCGQSLPDQQVIIVDPQALEKCTENQVGEIWVSGPSVAQGYWHKSEETRQTFQAYLNTGEGPFLRTGDLGFLSGGELFITGRIKDVIIIRGQNHYPQDIEYTVENSHPALRPGCGAAFAVEIKGVERLVVVQEVERSYLRKLNVELNVKEVVGNIRQSITAQHDLQVYAAILLRTGTIPKTSSGKIRRLACKAEFMAGTLEVIEDWSENPQCRAEFMHLQADVDSVLQKLLQTK